MTNPAVVYTRYEAAQRARLGLSTLDELIKQNAFPVIRPSIRRILIPAASFDRWLNGVDQLAGQLEAAK